MDFHMCLFIELVGFSMVFCWILWGFLGFEYERP